jgi:hypothetical protein
MLMKLKHSARRDYQGLGVLSKKLSRSDITKFFVSFAIYFIQSTDAENHETSTISCAWASCAHQSPGHNRHSFDSSRCRHHISMDWRVEIRAV